MKVSLVTFFIILLCVPIVAADTTKTDEQPKDNKQSFFVEPPAMRSQETIKLQRLPWHKGTEIVAPPQKPITTSRMNFYSIPGVEPPSTIPKQEFLPGIPFYKNPNITAPDYHNPYNPGIKPFISFASIGTFSGAPRTVYSDFPTTEFSGGLNLITSPNQIADNEALELENFIWTSSGHLVRRPGFKFRKDQTTQFDAGKRITGLYAHYTPDGDKIILAGVPGALYADTNETGTYVQVKSGLQSTTDWYDFESFKGKMITVHPGDRTFMFDENLEEPTSFGLADSFTWIDVYTSADYCTLIYTVEEQWQVDQWAGFLLCDNKLPYEASSGEVPLVIHSNTSNTLTVLRYQGSLNYWHKGYIFSLFDYDTIQTGLKTEGNTGSGCDKAIYNSGTVFDTSMEGKSIVAKFYMGDAAGQERIIVDVPDAHHLDLQYPFDPEPANGDSFNLLQKTFFKVSLCEAYKNRLFLVDEDKDIIYFSAYNEYTSFDPDRFLALKSVAGDRITALATFYDDQLGYKDQSRDCLVIFKENSIWKLVWNSETDYYLVQVIDGVGCVAPKSIVNVRGKYLLFLHTTGVYAFDGRTVSDPPLSANIQPIIDVMNAHLDMAAGGYHDDHYYLCYTDSTNGYNRKTIVMSTLFGAWSRASKPWAGIFAAQSSLNDSTDLIFADYYDRSVIYEFDMAETDTGQAIPLSYKSKAYDLHSIGERKRFTYFDIDYYLGSGNFSVYFYTDFGDSLRYNTTVTESGGYRYERLPLDVDCVGETFAYKITSSNELRLGKMNLRYKKIKE